MKVYIVKYSFVEYDYYEETIHKVFKNKEDADREVEVVTKDLGTAPEFPYKNKEKTMEKYDKGLLTKEQIEKINVWIGKDLNYDEFNRVWVEEYDVE